jgi:hypothetical protein
VYEIIFQYSSNQFPDDNIIKELIAIDYYLQHKIKPQQLFIQEIEHSEKFQLIRQLSLNHHKNRFIILPISFDFNLYLQENRIERKPSKLIIQYNGISAPKIINTSIMEKISI